MVRCSRRFVLPLLLVGALPGGCRRAAAPAGRFDAAGARPVAWPALPRDPSQAAALIAAATRRSLAPHPRAAVPRTAEAVLALLRQRQRERRVVAGWSAIVRWLEARLRSRGGYLLWGTFHDAGGQLEAFRRLVGPTGIRGLDVVALEQLVADGHWSGLAPIAQRGSTAALAAYLSRGDPAAYRRLLRDQIEQNHTAWKFRYLDGVMDIVQAARATATRLIACDMPGSLQRRLRPLGQQQTDRLRELHCLWTVDGALGGARRPSRVAMAWGPSHLEEEGVPRFLDPALPLVALYVIGNRPGPAGLEAELGRRLALTDPLLVPVDGQRQLVLLAGPDLAARLDRSRDWLARALPAELAHAAQVTSGAAGVLHVASRVIAIPAQADPVSVELEPGGEAFLFEAGALLLAGRLPVPRGGATELDLDPRSRGVRLLLRIPPR